LNPWVQSRRWAHLDRRTLHAYRDNEQRRRRLPTRLFCVWERCVDDIEEFVPDPGPGLVAHIAIVVARAGDDRVLARMDERLAIIELRAQSADDLAVCVGRYGSVAVRSVGDPGYGNVGVPLNAAIRSGVSYERAARGGFLDADTD
jgi:hypothetical protein